MTSGLIARFLTHANPNSGETPANSSHIVQQLPSTMNEKALAVAKPEQLLSVIPGVSESLTEWRKSTSRVFLSEDDG